MPEYDLEAVDKLPFSTPEKAQRYQTENYRGAWASTGTSRIRPCSSSWPITYDPMNWRSQNPI